MQLTLNLFGSSVVLFIHSLGKYEVLNTKKAIIEQTMYKKVSQITTITMHLYSAIKMFG